MLCREFFQPQATTSPKPELKLDTLLRALPAASYRSAKARARFQHVTASSSSREPHFWLHHLLATSDNLCREFFHLWASLLTIPPQASFQSVIQSRGNFSYSRAWGSVGVNWHKLLQHITYHHSYHFSSQHHTSYSGIIHHQLLSISHLTHVTETSIYYTVVVIITHMLVYYK